jgi:type II secretory pathway component GspD/PulD (secretin)
MIKNIPYPQKTYIIGSAIIFWMCIFFIVSFLSICMADSVAVIEVKYRRADEVVPMVKNLISQDGTVTVDQRTNSLIISDSEDSIQKIKTFLDNYDKPIQQVTVHVRFNEVRSEKGGSVSADAHVSGKGWSASTGGKTTNGVDVRVRGGDESRKSRSEYFIRAASGSPAYILAGQEIPYTDRWLYLCRRYARVTESVVFHKIESGFDVVPVVMGDSVSIDITPRISYEVPGREPGIIRFTRASTSLQIPMNEWVTIGGTSETDNEVITAILETGAHSQSSRLAISLKVVSDK